MSIRELSASRKRVVTAVSMLLLVALGTFAVAEAQRPDGESALSSMWRALVSEPAREAAPPWARRLMDFLSAPRFVASGNPAPAATAQPAQEEHARRERPIPPGPIDREDVYAAPAQAPAPAQEVAPAPEIVATRARPVVDSADPYGVDGAATPTVHPLVPAAPAARTRLISSIESDNPYL